MSQRSGMLLGNHSGIQENEARKKIQLDRCTTEPLNRAVVLSALSISHTTEHGRRCSYVLSYSTSLKFNLKLRHWSRSSCYCQQLTLFSFFFFSLSFSLCTHSHTNASPPSFSFYSFTCFFFSPLRFFFLFFFLHCHPSTYIGPLLGGVPLSRPPPSHLLMISLLSLNCRSLTNNDQQPVYLQCQGKNLMSNCLPLVSVCVMLLSRRHTRTFLRPVPIWWCQRWIVGFWLGAAYG